MESDSSNRLVGPEIHGFHTLLDLDVGKMKEEARTRWLRPNEIYAMLCNNYYFNICVKPVHLPQGGTIVFFDRRKFRNFRKDGHNWKKKKDGKTVKEAHEHLKVGNEERIHVYYAHGQDNPFFVRRCYWLLDKTLEHVVLVHYRDMRELQDSPGTPVNSNSSSLSEQSASWPLSEEFDSGVGHAYYARRKELLELSDSTTVRNHEMKIHEINTLEWDELVTNDPNNPTVPRGDKISCFDLQNQTALNSYINDGCAFPAYNLAAGISPLDELSEAIVGSNDTHFNIPDSFFNQTTGDSLGNMVNDGMQSQDIFGKWMNSIVADSPCSVDDAGLESSISTGPDSFASQVIDQHQSSAPEQKFIITDVSPGWAFSNETTKILVIGYFPQQYLQLAKSNLFCICGDACVPAEIVQAGVYRCVLPPHSPGLVNLCLSLVDCNKLISQVLKFEYRAPLLHDPVVSSEGKPMWEEFQLQMRLARLLFSTCKRLNILTSKVSPINLDVAKKFANRTNMSSSWAYLIKSIMDNRISFAQAKDGLLELILKNIIKEWLLERVVDGCKITEHDDKGQGVIHLCAILGYTWAVYLFSWSGLSLDFRDKHGWTALHWAACFGKEKMVAVLLSAGAKPNLVTDPTAENPGGCTAADLASRNGYDGLAAYLSEKCIVAQFEAMSIAGNVSGSLQTSTTDAESSENLSEEQLYLKDALAAYRTAADAAARIQAAFREHSLKVRTKAVQFANPEAEAQNIVAAMKIQHAYRNYEFRKKIAAAARIQYRFRTWKMRKEFLNKRRQVIKIQAAFRGFQVRRQYHKFTWSVGVLEKAILRWRLKRRGLRGLHVEHVEATDQGQESDAEEDFYKASRRQAEERIERSVVRVQALFRSKKAQEEYLRMKLAHNQAKVEYDGFLDDEVMDSRHSGHQ